MWYKARSIRTPNDNQTHYQRFALLFRLLTPYTMWVTLFDDWSSYFFSMVQEVDEAHLKNNDFGYWFLRLSDQLISFLPNTCIYLCSLELELTNLRKYLKKAMQENKRRRRKEERKKDGVRVNEIRQKERRGGGIRNSEGG